MHLPAELQAVCDFSTLRLESGSFVEDNLRPYFSDVLYSLRTTTGDDGYIGSMSAYPGTDRNGPYALFSSATVWDHSQSQNSQMNLKLHPTSVRGAAGSRKLLELTLSYLRKGGFHIQYNIVDFRTLRDAQQRPENYRELMVRVAGFTQYWCEIGKPIQDEVIARTEYEEM